jgi:hypothetical protein
LIPALVTVIRNGIRTTIVDSFVFATISWMLIASITVSGPDALSSAAGGEALEFLGAYLVGRAFLWQERALRAFVQILGTVVLLLSVLALADLVSGQWVAHNFSGSITGVTPLGANFRNGVIRATATLDHPILLAVLFAISSAIFLFSTLPVLQRLFLIFVCVSGCVFAQSSAGIMAWMIGLASFTYDQMLRTFSRRWTVFWGIFATFAVVVISVTNAPLGWIITHLTLDPESGYFRYLIWNVAIDRISDAPWVGYAFNSLNNPILDATVDSVWLVSGLHYGLPTVVFLFLANLAAIWPPKRRRDGSISEHRRYNTGFAVALCLFMFLGLTVHFWNFIWIFWGVCLGIKSSLRQQL